MRETATRFEWIRKRISSVWPEWSLAIVLVLIGVLNILGGLRLPAAALRSMAALRGIAHSLSVLGGTAQVIVGVMLVGAAVGLLRRLSFAWTLALWLLVITVGVDLAQARWGVSLVLESLMLVALWLSRQRFSRRSAASRILFSLSSVFAILTYGVVGSYLLGAGFHPRIRDFGTALYYTIVTLSTVGYGDVVPVTPEARWFAVSLLVVGLGVFASVVASVVGPKISEEVQRLFNPKEKTMGNKNHVILVGEGSIARNTARELLQRGTPFVQIVASLEALPGGTDHQIIEGDATDDHVLRQAGIQDARLLIAARDDDGENAFIALVAKDLNPTVKLLAVASSRLAIRRLRLARADLVFSPAAVGSRLLADLVDGADIPPAFRDLLEGDGNNA